MVGTAAIGGGAGQGARLNSGETRKRADDMRARLDSRPQELELEALISPLPPVALGGVQRELRGGGAIGAGEEVL